MDCNCTPIKTILINKLSTKLNYVLLTPSTPISASDLINLNKYRFIIATDITKAKSNLPIFIAYGSETIPLICRYAGNSIFPDQLCTRKCYTVVYGNLNSNSTNGQFVLQNPVHNTSGSLV